MDWLDLLAVQGALKSLLQHHSSKASILWCSAFFTVQLSHPYMTTGKTIALTRRSYFSRVQLIVTLWTVACQAPLSMGFSRQEYWSGLSCPPPGDLPNPGIEHRCPALAGGFFTTSATWEDILKMSALGIGSSHLFSIFKKYAFPLNFRLSSSFTFSGFC